MGLDISVNVTPKEVLDSYELKDHPELLRLFQQACEREMLKEDETISTRPGSYSGLHRLRTAYAEHKGIKTDGKPTEWQTGNVLLESHLVHHSDCDGWYLPDDFDKPILQESGRTVTSIGSSKRLLAELRELDREKMQEWAASAWDAVFVAAVASVFCDEPIKFH